MIPSHPPLFYLKAYDADMDHCVPNPKSLQGGLGGPTHSRLFLAKGSPENLNSVFRDPDCFQTRMCHQTPLYFTQNMPEAPSSDLRGTESHQTTNQHRLPLVYVRSTAGDRREFHTSQESSRTEEQQQHLPCIFIRANSEPSNTSFSSPPDLQHPSRYQGSNLSSRNNLDYPNYQCHCSEGPQSTQHHHQQQHPPYVYVRSPTGDHGKPTRVAERIHAVFPSPPPPVSLRRFLPDQREPSPLGSRPPSSMGRQQPPLFWVRPVPDNLSDFYPNAEPVQALLQHQPFRTSVPQPPRELHRPDGPQNIAQHAHSYFWLRSGSGERRECIPSPEAHTRLEQQKPSYVWIRNSPRARSELHAEMESSTTVAQHHLPVSIRSSPECRKNSQNTEVQPSLMENPPSFILIRSVPEHLPKFHPSEEGIAGPGRTPSPLASNINTQNNKSSPSDESLQNEVQSQSTPISPKDHLQSSSTDFSVKKPHAPASRRSLLEGQNKPRFTPQDLKPPQPPLYLFVKNVPDVPSTQSSGTERLPQPHVFIRTIRDCQDGANYGPEAFQTVIQGQLPFARQFPEGETYCKLEKVCNMVQEPSPSRSFAQNKSEACIGPGSNCAVNPINLFPSQDHACLHESLQGKENNTSPHAPVTTSLEDPLHLSSALQRFPICSTSPSSLQCTKERKDKSFSDSEQQQSNIFQSSAAEYLDRPIHRSGVLPTLIQHRLQLLSDGITLGHQREAHQTPHTKKAGFEQPLATPVVTANSKQQEACDTGADGQQTGEQEAHQLHTLSSSPAPRSSPASRTSPTPECPNSDESQQPSSMRDVSVNKNNSSPRIQSPVLLEEDQAPYMLVQSVLKNCDSCSARSSLRVGRHGQPPPISMTANSCVPGAAKVSPHPLGVLQSLEKHQTPRLWDGSMPVDHSIFCCSPSFQVKLPGKQPLSDLIAGIGDSLATRPHPECSRQPEQHNIPWAWIRAISGNLRGCSPTSADHLTNIDQNQPHMSFGNIPEIQKSTNPDLHECVVSHESCMLRAMHEAQKNSHLGSQCFQSSVHDQPPAKSVRIFPEAFHENSCKVSNLELHPTVDMSNLSRPLSLASSYYDSSNSQDCVNLPQAVQGSPKEHRSTDSSPEMPSAKTCQQPSLFCVQSLLENQSSQLPCSETQPNTYLSNPCLLPISPMGGNLILPGLRLHPSKDHCNLPFVFFRILKTNEHHNATHRCPDRLHQSDFAASIARFANGCSGSRRTITRCLLPQRITNLSCHASRIHQIMLQYRSARQSLCTIPEDENEVGRSSDCCCSGERHASPKLQLDPMERSTALPLNCQQGCTVSPPQ